MDFWRTAAPLPRAALVLAGVSIAVMLGTLLGLTANGMGLAFHSLHLAVMALGLLLVARMTWYQFRSPRRPEIEQVQADIPRSLKVLTGAASLRACC